MVFNNNKYKMPVIMYHDFAKELPKSDPHGCQYITTPKSFEENIKTLLSNKYTPISLMKLFRIKTFKETSPKKPLIITFDDGLLGQYTLAFPIIKKYNLPVVMFLTTDLVGKNTNEEKYFSWDNAKEMQKSGLIEIASHGKKHIAYNEMPLSELKEDVSFSFKEISKNLGSLEIKLFSYPFGLYNKETRQTLKELGTDIQATGLGMNYVNSLILSDIKRINISYDLKGRDIIKIIKTTD